jgi:hypothetical protein
MIAFRNLRKLTRFLNIPFSHVLPHTCHSYSLRPSLIPDPLEILPEIFRRSSYFPTVHRNPNFRFLLGTPNFRTSSLTNCRSSSRDVGAFGRCRLCRNCRTLRLPYSSVFRHPSTQSLTIPLNRAFAITIPNSTRLLQARLRSIGVDVIRARPL